MELTKEIAYKAISEFFEASKPFVLFGTGTSCALDLAFGMPALEQHLKAKLSSGLNDEQLQQWTKVTSALDNKTHDFESAMDFIEDEELTNKIVEITASFIANKDHEYSGEIIQGKVVWPAGKLFKKLVDTLPETNKRLHVATPNYDMLAEYSFIHCGIKYITGFHGSYSRNYDWSKSSKLVKAIKNTSIRGRKQPVVKELKHIRLHKPHGSINTFEVNNRIVECDAWIMSKPENITRSMITPGTSKYQKLHNDRAQLIDYDKAVQEHDKFLFLGFGFNDSQLVNNTFKQKLRHDKCHSIIITRSSNERLEEWLRESPNTWLVCKQNESDKTMISNSEYENPLKLNDKELWRFDHFTDEFLGG